MTNSITINNQLFTLEPHGDRTAVVTRIGNINIRTWCNAAGRDAEAIARGEYQRLEGLIAAVRAVDALNNLKGVPHHALIA